MQYEFTSAGVTVRPWVVPEGRQFSSRVLIRGPGRRRRRFQLEHTCQGFEQTYEEAMLQAWAWALQFYDPDLIQR